ncbi:MAG: hypothetical protein H6721_02345 [Sandaracinus sp.]|nr:hypothetical protein [Sandaracinus sp.]MCB9630978.1 hypothetical protein [Sandaracinus sp.]
MRKLLLGMCILALAGCGDDDTTPGVDAGPGTDADTTVDGGPVDNGVVGDEIFDGSCSSPRCSGSELATACVCVPPPASPDATPDAFTINRVGCSQLESDGVNERNEQDDFCDEGGADRAPNLSCMQAGMYRVRGEVQMVTMYGVVDVFGNGADADDILVEVYEEGANGALGALLGSATAQIEDDCSETDNVIEDGMVVQSRRVGFFSIPNVPSETPLIVKTSGDASFWRNIYSYNIEALNDEIETGEPPAGSCSTIPSGPRWEYRARIISSADWRSIPLTAGLVDGIRSGSGAVAGEIHDCDDIRLEFAQIGTNPPAAGVFTYFNDNPTNPLPDTSRDVGTSLLGLYGALDIPAGPVDVAAVGRLDGQTVTLGWYKAQVFAGAVTTVTLRGLRSHQVPAE